MIYGNKDEPQSDRISTNLRKAIASPRPPPQKTDLYPKPTNAITFVETDLKFSFLKSIQPTITL
jgi:hypothetical protein